MMLFLSLLTISSSAPLHLPPSCHYSTLTSKYHSPFVVCPFALPEAGCRAAPGIEENFQFLRRQGSGGFGSVTEVKRKVEEDSPMEGLELGEEAEERELVIKESLPHRRGRGQRKEEHMSRMRKEAVVGFKLSSLSNRFVRHFAAFMYDDGMCLLMEKVRGRDLFTSLHTHFALQAKDVDSRSGRLPEHVVREIMHQTLEGVRMSHQAGIELGDIKLENLMLDRPLSLFMRTGGRVKIVDYGFARVSGPIDDIALFDESWMTRSSEGTPGFLPPSLLKQDSLVLPVRPSAATRDKFHQDVFALGVSMIKLLTGAEFFPSFQCVVPPQFFRRGRGEGCVKFHGLTTEPKSLIYGHPFPDYLISSLGKDFLESLLNLHEFSPPDVLLSHPWFMNPVSEIRREMLAKCSVLLSEDSFPFHQVSTGPSFKSRIMIYKNYLLPPLSAPPLPSGVGSEDELSMTSYSPYSGEFGEQDDLHVLSDLMTTMSFGPKPSSKEEAQGGEGGVMEGAVVIEPTVQERSLRSGKRRRHSRVSRTWVMLSQPSRSLI